jgi:dethiobiotin synthetase
MGILLVTGTDTGVGKTLVTAAIGAALRARGLRVDVAKPAETGCATGTGDLVPEDALTLAAAVESGEPLATVCPYRFPDPLAPALAAERVGVRIDVDALVRALRARAQRLDLLLVEGAGGLLVPLAPATTYADLAAGLGAQVALVVGSRLGAINHALLTLEVLATRRLAVRGYVLNRLSGEPDLAVETNGALLARLTATPCRGALPWVPDARARLAALRAGGAAAAAARQALAALALEHLDLDALAGTRP